MKLIEDFLKKHCIEIYYILCFILICFVMYGIYMCVQIYGCRAMDEFLSQA